MLPLASILCAPQVRTVFEAGPLKSLAASMQAVGQQQPVRVAPSAAGAAKPYTMLDGERRLRAALLLGWEQIAAIVETHARTDAEVTVQALVANCQRESLSPIELAYALDRLVKEGGMSQEQAAAAVAFSPSSVSRTLTLLALPEEVRNHIHHGRIPASTGYAIAKVRDPRARSRMVDRALAGELPRDKAASESRRRPGPPAKVARVRLALGGGAYLAAPADALLGELVAGLREVVARLTGVSGPGATVAQAARVLEPASGDERAKEAS